MNPIKQKKIYKYTGLTKDGFLIQSDILDHFRLQDLTQFTVTEQMTEEQIRKEFGTDYDLPADFSIITKLKLKSK